MLLRLFRNRWVRGTVVTVLVLLAVVSLVSVSGYFRIKGQGEQHQAQVLADLDATEPGWRFEQIQAARQSALPPPEKNVIEQAMKLADRVPGEPFREWSGGWPTLPAGADREPPTAEELTHCRKLVGLCGEVIPEARNLRHLSGGVVVPLAENPIATAFPHLDKAGRIATVLFHDATVSAAVGRTDDALDDALAVIAIARGLEGEPYIISQLFRLRFLASAVRTVERTLRTGEATDAKLAEVEAALTAAAKVRAYPLALRGERASMSKLADLLHKDPGQADGLIDGKRPPKVVTAVATSALLPETHARYLELMTRAVTVAEKPPGPERNAEFAQIDADVKADATLEGDALRLVFPAIVKAYDADVRTTALLWMGVLAMKVERQRIKTGELPDFVSGVKGELSAAPSGVTSGMWNQRKPSEWWCVYFNPTGRIDATDDGPKTDAQLRLYDVKHRTR